MKKLLSITLLIFCCCMLFVGCTAKENAETITKPIPQKHIVSLTMNNYSTYIETSFVAYLSSTPQKVVFTTNGCLSYAYYENVVFEIDTTEKKCLLRVMRQEMVMVVMVVEISE